MRSLRSRLIASVVGGIAVLLVLFGAVVYLSVRHALTGEFDRSLAATTRSLMAATELEDGEVEIEYGPEQALEGETPGAATYFQFWLADGTVVMRSASLGAADLPRGLARDGRLVCRATVLPHGEPVRVAGVRFTPEWDDESEPSGGPFISLVVARRTAALAAQLRALAWLLAGAGAAIMLVALLVAWAVVTRGLAPLTAMADRIHGIREHDLADRVPNAGLPSELAPVADRVNGLLARLQTAFERERAFTSDVAHELRTPLAGIRSTIEVGLAQDREPAAYRESLADCLTVAKQTQAVVDNLLLLAQLDAGKVTPRRQPVRLAERVRSCWRAVAGTAETRDIAFENHVGSDLTSLSDPDHVAMMLANLLSNAVEYADAKGRIWVDGRAEGGAVELTVANTGCSLTPEQVRQAGERFWRADASRTDTGAHAGLGLALVTRIAATLGGAAAFSVEPPDVFTARVTLPGALTRF